AHVDGLGDVNGDGFDDIGYTTWASLDETSEVRVHLGGPELSEEPIWTGEQGPFHEKVHGVGDVDGDGYDDVLLTARPNARLHRGGPDGLQEASWAFGPEGYGGELATSGGRAGDLNGDGLMDVVLGDAWARAPGSDVLDGAVYVWLGRPQGLAATPDITLFGDDQSLGHTLAAGGDLDGDGYDDLLVTDNMDGRGDDLYVYSGGPEGLHPDRRWGVALPLGVEVEGRPVAVGVGDTDGDGRGEVLMNVERDGDGVVELWTRATSGLTGPVWTHRWIGRHRILVAPGGDLDGDGLQDVLYGEDDAVFGADLFALTGPFQEPLEDHDPYASLH
ncbi:MAG: VCBS repeat-containing protein, partial [Myxococcales bacterium]|nr:VCBS repeat-containing protein [Myxococcales bacterium]